MSAVLLVSGPDRMGLVAGISQTLLGHGGNILHAEQHLDTVTGQFYQRIAFDETGLLTDRNALERGLADVATRLHMEIKLHFPNHHRIAVFGSITAHGLFDLLSRRHAGDLDADIPLVISNHDHLRPVADLFGVPYHHVPVTPSTKAEAEATQRALLEANDINLVALANYKQILSKEFVAAMPHRIINIHPSFLPAFPGERPYQKAYERGVKLVGVTSHYVTEVLDDGPIIEQDVARVTHRDFPEDLARIGRELENRVLFRAIRAHIEHRILVVGTKTIVFSG